MYISDENILKTFKGDGSLNKKGQTFEEFLLSYKAKAYDNPSNTVDLALFIYDGKNKDRINLDKILLIKRGDHPCIGMWALPGGFVNFRESHYQAALRELEEESSVKGILPIEVAVYSQPDRDPRTRVVSTLFTAAIEMEKLKVKAGDDAAEAAVFDLRIDEIGEDTIFRELGEFSEKQIDYSITLTNNAEKVQLKAIVRETSRSDELFTASTFTIVENVGVASDHAAMIVEAYLNLKARLEFL